MTTKSQTDNTELDEIKKTVWECIRYNEFNLSDTEAVGVIMQAVEAKLKQQDIKSRIDELKKPLELALKYYSSTGEYNFKILANLLEMRLKELRSKL